MIDFRNILVSTGFQPPQLNEAGLPPMRWLHVGQPTRDQGWKLHLSTRSDLVVPFLLRIAPILLRAGQPFKVPATSEAIKRLNGGEEGSAQVGKIITIYPDSDDQAVELGNELAATLSGWPGPTIDNEVRVTKASPVFARYGSFRDRRQMSKLGLSIPILLTPDGEPVPDIRTIPTHQALSISSPFRNGIEPNKAPLFGNRYIATGPLVETRRRKVLLGVDIDTGVVCVLKVAKRHAAIDSGGRDSAERLRYEWTLMTQIADGLVAIPSPMAFMETDDDAVLVMEHIEGVNLVQAHSMDEIAKPGKQTIYNVVLQMLQLVQVFHAHNLILGDITPANFVLSNDSRLYFVDLELCRRPGDPSVNKAGTHGYTSPDVLAGRPHSYADDLYSLAANIYFLTTGSNLAAIPKAHLALTRADMMPSKWAAVIEPLLSATDKSSEQLLAVALEAFRTVRSAEFQRLSAHEILHYVENDTRSRPHVNFEAELSRLAGAAGEAVAKLADWNSSGPGIWHSRHPTSYAETSRTFYSGDSGIAYGLLRIGLATGKLGLVEVSTAAAERLWRLRTSHSEMLPGLIVGEAGVGLLYLALYEVLGEARWLNRAVDISKDLSRFRVESPDLLHGNAGRGLYYTWLFGYTHDSSYLDAAEAIACDLRRNRITDGTNSGWRVPDGYGGLSGHIYSGMAHGSAGIAYFLAELQRITADQSYADLLADVVATLTGSAVGSEVATFLHAQSAPQRSAAWCHGTPGIALGLLNANRVMGTPAVFNTAERKITEAVARVTRLGPTQCHGLAGLIEVLLELFSVTGNRHYFDYAGKLGERLATYFTVETSSGPLFCSERVDVITPEFMVGATGCAAALTRLCNPDRFGHFLLWPKEAFRPVRG